MIRTEREISDESCINAILQKSTVCRLGMVDGDKPYVVPLCFGYDDSCLYVHGSIKGRKIDILRRNPNVCFEFDLIAEPIESADPCDWSMKYQSVIGFGKAVFLDSTEDKRQALDVIMAQYSNRQYQFPDNMLKATAVIKIEIDSITCKQAGV